MAGQLDHLIQVAGKYNIKIQVIPYGAGAHPAMDSTFNILEFAPPVPKVVYVEGLVGYNYLDRTADIDRYQGCIFLRSTLFPGVSVMRRG